MYNKPTGSLLVAVMVEFTALCSAKCICVATFMIECGDSLDLEMIIVSLCFT